MYSKTTLPKIQRMKSLGTQTKRKRKSLWKSLKVPMLFKFSCGSQTTDCDSVGPEWDLTFCTLTLVVPMLSVHGLWVPTLKKPLKCSWCEDQLRGKGIRSYWEYVPSTMPHWKWVTQSCPTLCDPMDCSPGQNTGVGSLSLL